MVPRSRLSLVPVLAQISDIECAYVFPRVASDGVIVHSGRAFEMWVVEGVGCRVITSLGVECVLAKPARNSAQFS